MHKPLWTLHSKSSRTPLFVHRSLWRNVDCDDKSKYTYSITYNFFSQSFMILSEDMALQRGVLSLGV